MMMLRVLIFTKNFFSKKKLLAVLVIATTAGPVAFAQRTTAVDAKGTLITTGNIVTESDDEPTTPAPIQGDVWFDTTNSLVKVWEGSMWKTVASTAGETDTSLSQDTTTGVITYTAEDGLDDTANVISATAGNLLSVGADGGAFFNQTTSSVSAGYRVWEFASDVEDRYLFGDLGFITYVWNAIPLNSAPVLVNSTGYPQGFSFNADGSIGLEAGRVYRVSVSLGLKKSGNSGLRLAEQGNPSNVLATSIEEYTAYYYDTVGVRMEAIVSPTTTANYNVEFYYNNAGTAIRTAARRYGQVIPRATFLIKVLK